MKKHSYLPIALASVLLPQLAHGQAFDISTFDPTATGPWSAINSTTLMVPKVPNGSIKLDSTISSAEYGGFIGVTVTPGVNAWILDFPGDRIWGGANDSSFTYYLAHDDDYLYVAVDAKDDVVNSDDPNAAFWKDDAIEIIVDALNDRLDNNTDSSKDAFGGHNYVNFEGRFSGWDDSANAKVGQSWASGVPWTYGANGNVFGFGKAAAGGWKMEVRFKKNMFEDPAAGNKLRNGYIMGFNIGMDDDDKKGIGTNGDKTRSQDLEIQYFWANRQRYKDLNAAYLDTLTPEDKAAQVWRTDLDNHGLFIDSTGRLSHGGTGEIIFGYDTDKLTSGKILYLCANADLSGTDDASVVALLRAAGYTVTPFTSSGPTGGDDMRAAAVGQDVILISESLGSGTTLEPIGDPAVQKFIYRDTNIPIISWEAFMWDNAEWTSHPEDFSNEFSFFGNTGRTEDTQPDDLKLAFDSLYIKKPAHPIAGGLTGKVKVYNPPYSLNYGKPSADADVIASVRENGEFPCLFVYEKGDKLVDGSVCPNKRIGLFTGQVASLTANWNPEIRWFTEAGKTLLLNTVQYALGKSNPVIPVEIPLPAAANLKLWLSADKGVTATAGSVSAWADQSGNLNNAAQSATAAQPQLVDNAVNKKPVIRFDGINDYLIVPNSPSVAIAGDITTFFVVKFDDFATFRAVWAKTSVNQPGPNDWYALPTTGIPRAYRGNGLGANGSVDGTAPLKAGEYLIPGFDMAGPTLHHYLNGKPSGEGRITAAIADAGKPLLIGTREDFVTKMKGDIAEIIIYNTALSDADRSKVVSYLGNKYGIPVTGSSPQLTVSLSGKNVTISWPQAVTGFTLESAAALPATAWQAVPGVVNNSVTVANAAGNTFYRLRQ